MNYWGLESTFRHSEQTYNLDCSKLDSTIDQISKDGLDLKAIIAVDIFGLPARFRLLEKLCKEKGIILIEDMAQSFGSSIRERKAGSFGDFSATSFFPLNLWGVMGMAEQFLQVIDEHADILKSIRVHGSGKNKYDNIRVGINGRLDTIQAAILLEKIEIFDHELLLREEVSEIYKSSISDEYIFQYIPEGYKSANAIFSVITHSNKNREKIISKFSEKNIPIMVYYPISLNKQPVFRNLYNFPAQKIQKIYQVKSLQYHFIPISRERIKKKSLDF